VEPELAGSAVVEVLSQETRHTVQEGTAVHTFDVFRETPRADVGGGNVV
jgi:hypothetical protein